MKKELNITMIVFPQGKEALKENVINNIDADCQESESYKLDDEKNKTSFNLKIFNSDINVAELCDEEKQLFVIVINMEQFEGSLPSLLSSKLVKIIESAQHSTKFTVINAGFTDDDRLPYLKFKSAVEECDMEPVYNHNGVFFIDEADYCSIKLSEPGSIRQALSAAVARYNNEPDSVFQKFSAAAAPYKPKFLSGKKETQLYHKVESYGFLAIGTLTFGAFVFGIIANCGVISAAKLAPLCLAVGGVMIPHVTLAAAALLLLFMLGVGAHRAYDHYNMQKHGLFNEGDSEQLLISAPNSRQSSWSYESMIF